MHEYKRKNGVFVVYHRNIKYFYGKTHKISFLHKIYIFWKIQFNRFLAHGQQRNLISNPQFHGWILQRFLYITISMIKYKNLYNFEQLHYRVTYNLEISNRYC